MDIATYKTIQPPFTLNFYEMSKKELKAYFLWFQDVMPERIEELASAVKSSPGFEDWRPDYSPSSLSKLGQWFATQIGTRQLTKEEIDNINKSSPYTNEGSGRELTNRTFSLAMDIGMYLSKVFLKNHPSLKWDQSFRSKRSIDYGQPVLIEFHDGKVPFNPVQMIVALAYGLTLNTRTGKSLRELYDIWSSSVV